MKIPYDDLVGVASGATGNPAILVYSTRMAPTERPDIGYAMIFPVDDHREGHRRADRRPPGGDRGRVARWAVPHSSEATWSREIADAILPLAA